jgi:NhaA family Na+:H+ antiporter
MSTRTPNRATWMGSDRFLARALARPVIRFLHVEAAGGIVLVLAALLAMVWANSPFRASYDALWTTDLALGVGRHVVTEDLRHWVNDGLMVLFFFVIGLEIRNELAVGDLRDRSRAVVPVLGAIGGMAVPALVYLAIAGQGAGADGWGIPMATDVAFALGVLSLLGSRVPAELKVLLLALAIVDDIGAIVVIAVFYSDDLHLAWLAAAVVGLLATVLLRRAAVRFIPLYAIVGAGVWFATLQSGVHATIAGVALGLLTPAHALFGPDEAERIADELSGDRVVSAAEVRTVSFRLREGVAPTDRLLELLHPWTSYVVIPTFALANSGVDLSLDRLGDAATSRITIGVAVGLVLGKLIGVAAGIGIAVRSGIGTLPVAIRARHVVGLALVAGVGFTVSIFVSALAFPGAASVDDAKIGVLGGSLVAGLGATLVLLGGRREAALDDVRSLSDN